MADASKESLLHFVRRIGAFLTYKLSNLRLDSRSVGALAGLAFATVFIWRVLRAPTASRGRQPKRQSSGVGGHDLVNASSSGVSNRTEDFRVQHVVDEIFQPSKLTFSQTVRQRLSEGRKVTCRMLDIILQESSSAELQKQASVRPSVLETLLEITKLCDFYLMETVLDDESEKNVLAALEDAGVFTSGGLVKDKVLFCSTEIGRTSFVRQLEPDWHIDSNPEIVTQLSRFIKYQLHVSPVKLERPPTNVFSSSSLEQFFGCVS